MRGHSNLPDKTSNENTQALENHVKDKENPHGVTAEQILLNDGSTVEDAVSEIAKNVNDDGVMSVAGGGTGKSSLTKGSYLVGNGTEDVVLKTPAEVLSEINASPKILEIVNITGSITLSSAYLGKHLCCANTSDIVITVPSGLGAGFNCTLEKWGAGGINISGSGVTLNGASDALALGDQYDAAVSIIMLTDTVCSVKGGLA